MSATNLGGLSPEVISGRLYAGAGDGPLLAAAAVWDRLAGAWGSALRSYRAVVAELTDGPWRGAAAASMAEAAQQYAAWMQTIADGAEQTANRLRVAAAVYRRAFAAVVPPSVVAANRSELSSLVAGNVFGQNTGLIAANQAEYAQMSAQDVAAMYDYAAGSAAATTLPSFSAPPNITAGAAGQTQAAQAANQGTAQAASAASNVARATGNSLIDLANGPLVNNATVSGLNNLLTLSSTPATFAGDFGFVSEGIQLFEYPLMLATGKLAMLGPPAWAKAGLGAGLVSSVAEGAPGAAGYPGPSVAGAGATSVSAGLGRAATLGELSVPASWGAGPREAHLVASALPGPAPGDAAAPPGIAAPAPGSRLGGPIAGVVNTPRTDGAPARIAAPEKARQPAPAAADDVAPARPNVARGGRLADGERRELVALREEMAELARECDVMTRLMRGAGR